MKTAEDLAKHLHDHMADYPDSTKLCLPKPLAEAIGLEMGDSPSAHFCLGEIRKAAGVANNPDTPEQLANAKAALKNKIVEAKNAGNVDEVQARVDEFKHLEDETSK